MPAYVTIIAGLLAVLLLFYRRPYLTDKDSTPVPESSGSAEPAPLRISVIIPARNEERSLPNILTDLRNQESPAYEIICVDDGSTDRTAAIINEFAVRRISVTDKPDGWVGKTWACQCGADRATGDLLLFIDADVRMSPTALRRLIGAYQQNRCVISVQPFHRMQKLYEQSSFFFSLILLAANGLGFPFLHRNIGLFGPVILTSREEYDSIKGHYAVKNSIIDDLALGEAFKRKGIRFALYMGGRDISFRMYPGGFLELCQGWIKNYASGAFRTPIYLILLIILWFGGCISVIIELIRYGLQGAWPFFGLYAGLYLAWVLALWLISRRAGNFKAGAIFLYPLLMINFLTLFIISLFRKFFIRSVTWKGRKIKL